MKPYDGTGPTDRCVEHIPSTGCVQLDQLGRVHVKPPDLCAHARMLACMMRACKCVYVCRCVCVSVCMHAWACVRVFARKHVQLRGMSVRAQKRRTAVETTRSISSCRRAPICQGTHVRYRCTAAACLGELRCGCYAARRLPTHGRQRAARCIRLRRVALCHWRLPHIAHRIMRYHDLLSSIIHIAIMMLIIMYATAFRGRAPTYLARGVARLADRVGHGEDPLHPHLAVRKRTVGAPARAHACVRVRVRVRVYVRTRARARAYVACADVAL
jgi:hypothetical protein